ncbi:MAG: ribonuclease P protein component [Chloroflexi bacterium]|nr:ribonuclease P protein component [Chloroflexota bacterium]MBI4216066.1 ribonuclease P protein component [Chloroflexota bacterium]
MTFPQRERLSGGQTITSLSQKGRRWANRHLVLRAQPNGQAHNRYGFTVSRRLGPAVGRNRLRRQLREGVRSLPLKQGWDLLFIARLPAREASFDELRQASGELLSRASLLEDTMP